MDDFELKIKVDSNEVKNTLPSLRELRKEMKAIQDTMAGLDEGSDEFLKAANKAGTLKHQIDEIREATAGASADFGDLLGNVSKSAAGITGAFQMVQGALNLLGVESESVTESIKTMQSMMAITQGLTAIDAGIKSLAKLRNAITATTTAAKLLKAALQPKTILAITAAITALTFAYDKLTAKSREAAKAREEELKQAKEIADAYNNDVAKAGGKLLAVYENLRQSYIKLSTAAEKNKWIKDNQTALSQLGISLNSVNQAEDFFIKNSKNVIEGFQLRAEAAANENLAIEAYEKYLKKKEEVEKYKVKEGDIAFGETNNFDGKLSDRTGRLRYTKYGAEEKNKQIDKEAGIDKLKAEADRRIAASAELKDRANTLLDIGNQVDTKSTVKVIEQTKTAKEILKEEYDLAKANLELSKEKGEQDTEGVGYYEKLLKILTEYRDKLKQTADVSEIEMVRIETEIAKTNNIISNFGNTDQQEEKSDFELRAEEIETVLAQINAEFAASNQEEEDTIRRLQEIILFEKERLQLMSEMGQEGTAAWYQQKQAISEYEKQLQEATDKEKKFKDTVGKVSNFTVQSFDAIGGVLGDLANTQDTTSREGFETAKKLNIAQATMSMLSGLTSIIAGTYTTHTGPWDIALAAVQAAAVLASGIININNIKKQTFDGGSTASTASANVSQSTVSQVITPPVQQVNDVQGTQLLGELKDTRIYVSETDLQRVNKKVTVQEKENTY